MAKIKLLAVLSLDGCLSEMNRESRWWLRPESYGITEIRDNASLELTSDISLSMLINWKMNEDDTVCYLIEATTNTAEFINGMLRMRLIDEIILYTVPFIAGTGQHLFKATLPTSYWNLTEQCTYNGGISRTIYQRSGAEE